MSREPYSAGIRIARAVERLFGKQVRGTAPIYNAKDRTAQALELATNQLGDITTLLTNLDARVSALEGTSCLMLITVKVDDVATAGITVKAVSGTKEYTAVSDNTGVAILHTAPGTYLVSGVFDPSQYHDMTTTTITISEHEKKEGVVTAASGVGVVSIVVKEQPTKLTYTVGETFDPTGTVLTVTYTDETTADITEGYTYMPTESFTAPNPEEKITYFYSDAECTTFVAVTE